MSSTPPPARVEFTQQADNEHCVRVRFDVDYAKVKQHRDEAEQTDLDIDLDAVAKAVSLFNFYNKDIVAQYDYAAESEERYELQVLFRHVLKKMGEPQRYVHYHVELVKAPGNDRKGKLVFNKVKEKNKNPAFFKLRSKVEFLPIKNLALVYELLPAPEGQGQGQQAVMDVRVFYTRIDKPGGGAGADAAAPVQAMIEDVVAAVFGNMQRHVFFDDQTKQFRIDTSQLLHPDGGGEDEEGR